jgi:Cu/Ag efflux protein CusF
MMRIKKSLIHCTLTFAALGLSANTLAQVMAEGVVRRIDLENNKITILYMGSNLICSINYQI